MEYFVVVQKRCDTKETDTGFTYRWQKTGEMRFESLTAAKSFATMMIHKDQRGIEDQRGIVCVKIRDINDHFVAVKFEEIDRAYDAMTRRVSLTATARQA